MTASHGGGPDTPAQASSGLIIDEGLGPNVTATTPPERPTASAIEAARTACMRIIDTNEDSALYTLLQGDHETTLTGLFFHDPVVAKVLAEHLVSHALQRNYTQTRAKVFNLSAFAQRAKQLRHTLSAEAEALNPRRRTRGAHLRVINVSHGETAFDDLSPAQLMDSEDPFLRAIGRLQLVWHDQFWHDTFHNNHFTSIYGTPEKITDEILLDIFKRLLHFEDLQNVLGKERAYDAVSWVAAKNKKNEVRDWLETLTWDGVPRCSTLFQRAWHAEDTPLMRALGENFPVSMVARIFEPGCQVHHMPVFCGAQGMGKTKGLRLLSPREEWVSSVSTENHKELVENIAGKWIIEIAEMHSFTGKQASQDWVKAFVSNNTDRYRAPYAKRSADHPRVGVLAGTTNSPDYNNDPTGARRFIPVDLPNQEVDYAYIESNRDQLFAEAVTLYRRGHNWHLYPIEEQREAIEEHRQQELWEEVLMQRLGRGTYYDGWNGVAPIEGDPMQDVMSDSHWGSLITNQRIARQWLAIPLERANYAPRAITKLMRRLGWKSGAVRVGEKVIRAWKSESPRSVVAETFDDSVTHSSAQDEDDIPF